MFAAKGKLVTNLKLWWNPPPVPYHQAIPPHPDMYHLKRLLLWAPRMLWRINLFCPRCARAEEALTSKGLYNHVRLVMDVKQYYYVAAEYMYCRACSGTFISWDTRILSQLSDGVRARFPVLMTRKYVCDESVIAALRSRTLGNSPTALRNTMHEMHSEEWLRRQLDYLSHCQKHQKGLMGRGTTTAYQKPTPFPPFPTSKWFLAAYVRDVWSRMEVLLATATSSHGAILKIDSTKKVCKKLQGLDANTASWTTNVGNERGEILMSVLTSSESVAALQPMATGLMNRYKDHNQSPP